MSGLFGPEHMLALPQVEGEDPELVVTSPGIRPDHPVMLDAYERGIQVWGDVSWLGASRPCRPPQPQVAVPDRHERQDHDRGHDGFDSEGRGKKSIQVGNVGMPIVYAIADDEPYEFFAVELSSFQSRTGPSPCRPTPRSC